MGNYLSSCKITLAIKPSFEVMCRANNPSVDVAADRVYMAGNVSTPSVSSYLAFPSLPLSRRFLSVALSLGSPPAAVSSYSVSVKPGLSSGSPCRLSRRRMFHSFSQEVYHIPGALARKIISTVSAPTAAAAKSAVPSRRAGPIPRHRRP